MPPDEEEAKGLAYYRRAAELNDTRALEDLGFAYKFGAWGVPKDPLLSGMYFSRGAGQGDPECMLMVGERCLEDHRGADALHWFQQAADHGDPAGLEEMAKMYREGKEVPKDLQRAAALFRTAADQGYPSSQGALGEMSEKGEGLPRSDAQAYFWYARAAAILRASKPLAESRDRVAARLAPGERARLDARIAKIKRPDED
jgi:hypothetical protein